VASAAASWRLIGHSFIVSGAGLSHRCNLFAPLLPVVEVVLVVVVAVPRQ